MTRALVLAVVSLSAVSSQGTTTAPFWKNFIPTVAPSPSGGNTTTPFWKKFVPTQPPSNGSTTVPFWKKYVPAMPPQANGTNTSDAVKKYLRSLGIPVGNETKHWKHFFKSLHGAPAYPEACNTTHQLKKWRKAALKVVKATVPKAAQPAAKRLIEAMYKANRARIEKAEAEATTTTGVPESNITTTTAAVTKYPEPTAPPTTPTPPTPPTPPSPPTPSAQTASSREAGAQADMAAAAGGGATGSLVGAGAAGAALGMLAYVVVGMRRQSAAQGGLDTHLLP